jgi:hypothetical protein
VLAPPWLVPLTLTLELPLPPLEALCQVLRRCRVVVLVEGLIVVSCGKGNDGSWGGVGETMGRRVVTGQKRADLTRYALVDDVRPGSVVPFHSDIELPIDVIAVADVLLAQRRGHAMQEFHLALGT